MLTPTDICIAVSLYKEEHWFRIVGRLIKVVHVSQNSGEQYIVVASFNFFFQVSYNKCSKDSYSNLQLNKLNNFSSDKKHNL